MKWVISLELLLQFVKGMLFWTLLIYPFLMIPGFVSSHAMVRVLEAVE
jgi:hypothetical protein